jgi:hypothetical protein
MNEPLALLAIPDTDRQTWYVPVGDIIAIVDMNASGGEPATRVDLARNRNPIYSTTSASILVSAYHDIIRGRCDTRQAFYSPIDLGECDG